MELSCPACGARYSVPATAIPAGGRVVRCGDCRAEWMAMPVDEAASPPMAPEPAFEPTPQPIECDEAPPPRPEPEPAPESEPTLAERPAAFEAPAPEAEPAEDFQPDSTDDPLPEAQEAVEPIASRPEMATTMAASMEHYAPRAPAPHARREIGAEDAHSLAMAIDDTPEPKRGGGFVWGFALVTLVALTGVAIYARQGAIAEAVPAAAPYLERFVALVDEGRVALADAVAGFQARP
jgi:predicted Zn finger-like uncharacterized protein